MDDKKFAILIDSENISSKYVAAVMDEMTKHGIATYRRIYGDWTSGQAKNWKPHLAENSITPIQQFSNTVGKNSTDSALIIDAMDILYTGNVDGFCIVSSDGDFTRLASRLRESGMTVIGMGEEKTPRSFRAACSRFIVLENLIDTDEEELLEDENGTEENEKITVSGAAVQKETEKKNESVKKESPQKKTVKKSSTVISKKDIENAIISIITENENKGKETGLGEVGSRLINKYPDFDTRNYGYSLLSKFLEEVPSLELVKSRSGGINVELKDNTESKDEIISYIKTVVSQKGKKGMGVSELSNMVHNKYIRFNVKDYGYSQFTKFLQSIPKLEISDNESGQKKVRKAE